MDQGRHWRNFILLKCVCVCVRFMNGISFDSKLGNDLRKSECNNRAPSFVPCGKHIPIRL